MARANSTAKPFFLWSVAKTRLQLRPAEPLATEAVWEVRANYDIGDNPAHTGARQLAANKEFHHACIWGGSPMLLFLKTLQLPAFRTPIATTANT